MTGHVAPFLTVLALAAPLPAVPPAFGGGSLSAPTPEDHRLGPVVASREADPSLAASTPGIAICADPEPPAYYAFPMVTTRRVAGTGQATGTGHVMFAPSPFGIALASDGSYRLDLTVEIQRIRAQANGAYVVWLTTPSLDQVERAGVLQVGEPFQTTVRWNKFLVVVTHELDPDPEATMWSGPIVIRGVSRSGLMHTMAGHGPFEKENCAQYGY